MGIYHLKYPKEPNQSPGGTYDPVYQSDRGFGKVMFIPRVINDAAAFSAINGMTETIGNVSSLESTKNAVLATFDAVINTFDKLSGAAVKETFKNELQYVVYDYKIYEVVGTSTTETLERTFNETETKRTKRDILVTKIENNKLVTSTSSYSVDKTTNTEYGVYRRTTTKTVNTGNKAPLIIVMPLKPEVLSDIQHNFNWEMSAVSPGKQMKLVLEGVKQVVSGITGGGIAQVAAGGRNLGKAAIEKYGREGIMNALQNSQSLKIGNLGGAVYTPKRQMFQDVDIMSFTFEWDLIPRSKNEANEIIDIINAFRVLAYPWSVTKEEGRTNDAKTIVRQPAIWQIKFPQSGDKFNDLITKDNELLCIIKNVSMEIGRPVEGIAKIPQYTDGFPNIIKLKVTMQEYWSVMDAAERFGDVTKKFSNTKNYNAKDVVDYNANSYTTATETETMLVSKKTGNSSEGEVITPEVKPTENVKDKSTSYNKPTNPSAGTGAGTGAGGATGANATPTEQEYTQKADIVAKARREAEDRLFGNPSRGN
jgi:hypothetical protein